MGRANSGEGAGVLVGGISEQAARGGMQRSYMEFSNTVSSTQARTTHGVWSRFSGGVNVRIGYGQ